MKKTLILIITLTVVFIFTPAAFSEGLNGDFDNDGDVDAFDLAVFSNNFGKTDNICKDNNNCISDSYCSKEPRDCTGSGTCASRPKVCSENWDPVCGCDSITYYNRCEANRLGISVKHKGRCRLGECDDGFEWICDMVPPICSDFEILSLQNGCWTCVNPATCKPWGEPGCSEDNDCPSGMWCDPCGSSSCPFCDDCIPACVFDLR